MKQQRARYAVFKAVRMEFFLLFLFALCLLFVLLVPLAYAQEWTAEECQLQAAYESGQLIRLHILAENDEPESQRIKLCVRDAVLSAFGQELETLGQTDAQTVYAYLQSHVEAMQEVAQTCARENGFEGTVIADVGRMQLPEKDYGAVVLPQGEYRALRITLGSGQGRNWWCVLFPQLCLALASDEPWQTPAQTPKESDELVWDTQRIWECWTLWPL